MIMLVDCKGLKLQKAKPRIREREKLLGILVSDLYALWMYIYI